MRNGKPVVLTGDSDRFVLQIDHGLIGSSVSIAHFVGLQARGKPHQLMAETNAHDGESVLDGPSEGGACCGGFSGMSGVAWAVAAKQRVDIVLLSQPLVRHVGRAPDDVKDHAQMTQNVVLHAAV